MEDAELTPPSKRTSPDWRPQQRCPCLRSTRLTANTSNVETPSNFSQDPGLGYPPQRRLLQKLENALAFFRSPAGQDLLKTGLNSSVGSKLEFPFTILAPAAMINPPVVGPVLVTVVGLAPASEQMPAVQPCPFFSRFDALERR